MPRIGLVVNPIAGMGGRVGLKGTDGKVAEARALGAEPRAPERAEQAIATLSRYQDDVELLTYGGPMGEDVAGRVGLDPEVVGGPADPAATTADDTRQAVEAFVEAGVDLVLFVGGDGTAADVAAALEDVGVDAGSPDDDAETAMLGVPAGVKIYSAVFAVSPADAGHVAATFEATEPAEVNDVDESRLDEGEVHTTLRAVVDVPVAERRQSAKQPLGGSVEGLANGVAAEVREGVTYVFGPGSTVGAIEEALGFEGTPLGVDVWRDGAVLVRDASESEILDALGEENVVVVSPIGGQGFVFGRGNQQISPAVIERSSIEVVASRRKLDSTGVLRVDTGDPDLDEELRGWLKVRVGAFETRLVEVV